MWEALGWYGLFLSCLFGFLLGGLAVVWYIASQQAKRLLDTAPFHPTVAKDCTITQGTAISPSNSLSSGSQCVDSELQQVLDLCLRDYVQSWYHPFVSGSSALFDQAKDTTAVVLSDISRRCQEPELLPLFMEALVAILIDHFKSYKIALAHVTEESEVEMSINQSDSEGWSVICKGGKAELAYVRGITEYVLRLALPSEDFSNPLFRSLAQDLLAEQVLLPTAHYVTTSFYFNSTVVALAKETSLNGESLLIALSCASAKEISVTLSVTSTEINRLKKKGKTELDQFQLNSLNELKDQLAKIQENDLREADDVKYRGQFPSLTVTIPFYKMQTEGRIRHVNYKIVVQCQHKQGPIEEWVTWRRFSDLHDLHLKLKERSPDLPSLPSQSMSFNKLDPAVLDQKRLGMQGYLKFIASQDFLNSHPYLFGDIILFLTKSAYIRQSTEIARTVDKLVQPIVSSVRTRNDTMIKSSSPGPARKSFDFIEEEEDEEEGGVAILMTLLDEVFDVGDQWLQRQLSNLLKQLLGSMLSDKMGQRMMEALDNYASGSNIADLISQMRTSLWPDGYPAQARKPLPQETVHIMSLLARTKLLGSVPDDLKRLLGSTTTHKGIIRLFRMFQHESLNLRLFYRLMEALLSSLYPERDLSQAFEYLRSQIKLTYTDNE